MKTSKQIENKLNLIESFSTESNSWNRLKITGAKVTIDNLGLNKALKNYLETGKTYLTEKSVLILNFKNVVEFINTSDKWKDVRLFSTFDMVLICNAILKDEDKNIARAIRVAKQQAQTDKK
jgi:hypothetical protein